MTLVEYITKDLGLSLAQYEAINELAEVCGMKSLFEASLIQRLANRGAVKKAQADDEKQRKAAERQNIDRNFKDALKISGANPNIWDTESDEDSDDKLLAFDEILASQDIYTPMKVGGMRSAPNFNFIASDDSTSEYDDYEGSTLEVPTREDLYDSSKENQPSIEREDATLHRSKKQNDIAKIIRVLGELANESEKTVQAIVDKAVTAVADLPDDSVTSTSVDELSTDDMQDATGWYNDETSVTKKKFDNILRANQSKFDEFRKADTQRKVDETSTNAGDNTLAENQATEGIFDLIVKVNKKIAAVKNLKSATPFNNKLNLLKGMIYEFIESYGSNPFSDAFRTVQGFPQYQNTIDQINKTQTASQQLKDIGIPDMNRFSGGKQSDSALIADWSRKNSSRNRQGEAPIALGKYQEMKQKKPNTDNYDLINMILDTSNK